MINTLTFKVKESVHHGSLKNDGSDNKDKISCTIENGNQIINVNDGLTLQEVYDALIVMLNGDSDLVRKILFYAQEMVAHGVDIAQGSQLNRHDVYKMKDNLKNLQESTHRIKLLSNIHKDNTELKKNRKQSRGRG